MKETFAALLGSISRHRCQSIAVEGAPVLDMPQAMTKEERQQSSEKLEAKLVALREAIISRNVTEPSKEMLMEILSQRDIEAAWKMLERSRQQKKR